MNKDHQTSSITGDSQERIVQFNGEEFLKLAAIAKSFVDKGTSENPPKFVIIMGGVASGKTTLRRRDYSRGFVHVDPGDIFAILRKTMEEDDPKMRPSMAFASELLLEQALDERKNIVTEIVSIPIEILKPIMDKMTGRGY